MQLGNNDPARLHAWHSVALSTELGDQPLAVRLGDEPWVVVRLGATLAAFPDRCPHRRVPLSAGRVVGEELECAYHGWRFDTSGVCTTVPALGPGAVPPKGMRVDRAAGCVEKYGLIWLAPLAPVVGLPDIPDHDDGSLAWERLPSQAVAVVPGK